MIEAIKSLYTGIRSVLYSYYSGGWVRQPIIWGYSDVYGEGLFDTVTVLGNYSLSSTPVPYGEVWCITSITVLHSQVAGLNVGLYGMVDGVSVLLGLNLALPQYALLPVNLPIYLKEGDKIILYYYGIGVGQTMYLQVAGYKMEIDN